MLSEIEGLRVFTVDEYRRIGEAGVFAPGERVELIRGVNLIDDLLEIYRDPRAGVYRSREVLEPDQRVAPLAFSDLVMSVRDLLP